jgi:D-serine deaminase-like pyridoxal phosphate-dependent protein
MTYEGNFLDETAETMAAESRRCVQEVLDTRELLEHTGIPLATVSVGSTCNYEIAGSLPGVTEVMAGSYALMDAGYAPRRPQFLPAAHVLTTVSSLPDAETCITDAGQKAVSIDLGLPVVQDMPRATVTSLSAEHCRLHLDRSTRMRDEVMTLQLGSQLRLIPRDIGTCVNLYDYLHVVRDGRLQAVWRVAARGQYR